MSNVSVADILKIHGKWIESSQLIDLVVKKLKISQRQAYRYIKKDKQILKLVLSDRTVLYGLGEFGLPTEVRPSKFGLFEWLDKRAVRKVEKEREYEKQRLLDLAHYDESLADVGEEWEFMKKYAERNREKLRLLEKK